ncbi:MAG TPA: hypothetical protein VMG41_04895 [Gemmatimonadales bacterium]|nr:hypothetical protein [Gemmatimonadales bacterium]
MRNYWIKILVGAVAIFAVGMVIVAGFRKVTVTLKSSDPIPIPLIGLVPFRLDSARMGSVERVELLRSDPEHISGVRVLVSLDDSISPDRLRACRFELDNLEKLNDQTTFRCLQGNGETPNLEPFGTVVVGAIHDTFPLLVAAGTAREWRGTRVRFGHNGVQVDLPSDSTAPWRDSLRQELSDRVDAMSDSIDQLKDLAGNLEDSSANLDRTGRRRLQHSADSVRASMRAMVERMKADENRLKVLDRSRGMSPAELDSMSKSLSQLHDSILRQVTRQLEHLQTVPPAPAAPAAPHVHPSPPTPPPR